MSLLHKKIFYLSLSGILLVVLVSFAYTEWKGTHYYTFPIKGYYKIDLVADECTFCFLEWPIDYKIEITDLRKQEKHHFEFETEGGPCLRFHQFKDSPDQLLVEGCHYNTGLNWLINLDNMSIGKTDNSLQLDSFIAVYDLTMEFKLEKK